MKPHVASGIHALLLVGLGLWGYFESGSNTAFIPVGMGVALLLMNTGIKKENKVIAHIAVLVTLLAVLGMIKPLTSQLSQNDTLGIVRTALMLISGVYAMVTFIQSFIAARKAREE